MSDIKASASQKPKINRVEVYWHTVTYKTVVIYVLLIVAVGMGVGAWRSRYLPSASKLLIAGVALAVIVQALLGIATLMARVPIGLGVAHQLTAALTLSLAAAMAWRIRRV